MRHPEPEGVHVSAVGNLLVFMIDVSTILWMKASQSALSLSLFVQKSSIAAEAFVEGGIQL